MRKPVYLATILALSLLNCALAQDTSLPTRYLDCVKNAKSEPIASQELKSPVFTSKTGNRAYGIISAKLDGSSCQVTSKVYVSLGLGEFQVAVEQGAEQSEDGMTSLAGSGIQNLRWSPDGDQLLVEIWQWPFGDCCDRTKYIIISSDGSANKRIHPEDAVQKWFKKECSALFESTGWIDETHIGIEIKNFIATDEEGIPEKGISACVDKSKLFSFELGTGKVALIPPAKKQ